MAGRREVMRRARELAYRAAHRVGEKVYPETTVPAEHLVRIEMDRAIAAELDGLDTARMTAAEISGFNHAARGWAGFESLDFPEFDLCAPLAEEHRGRFDIVFCEQVLEHVYDPIAAVANLRELVRPGGRVVVSTPFMIRVHELPLFGMFDYWRFTPRGLKLLLEKSGLEVDQVGHWGNREAIVGNLDRWTARRRWHPMHNEPDIPVQVWAFATKPRESEEGRLQEMLTHSDPSQLWFQISEIAGNHTYLKHGITAGPGDVVIDAGANVGVAAAHFAGRGVAAVHSFEPVPAIHAMLEANLAPIEGATSYPFGLSDSDGSADFTYYEGAAAMSSRYGDPERDRAAVREVLIGAGLDEEQADARLEGAFEPRTVSCRLRTLSSVIDEQGIDRIDLLKVDVERAELDVLRGIGDEHWPRIRQVVAEVHDEDDRAARIRELLEDRGFQVTVDQEDAMRNSGIFMLYAARP